ncbi:hypothetical protein GA0116948_1355 [Chitinophaga costaii]|uniref:Uncharacterized protein n=1 Tax=Chitinophaga costaii TaxID=1335309 RepID=A0A1C4G8Y5_9BACT|nr:hypothetical protein [Chitinophaga costaii]PUZ19711.1 hypothetical protein DCM91_20300 [Chitinophaga costaii]SCC64632.1 hypothetical protein GA0116948_1355 [Chitinophaga costaii]
MIKKIIFTFAGILLLSGIVFFLLKYVFNTKNAVAPERPKSVPETAVWKGDFDEGFWIFLADTIGDSGQYRFKIFRDYNGELAFDGLFKSASQCSKFSNREQLLNHIKLFDFTKGYRLVIDDSCYLGPQLPPIGGSLWNIDN